MCEEGESYKEQDEFEALKLNVSMGIEFSYNPQAQNVMGGSMILNGDSMQINQLDQGRREYEASDHEHVPLYHYTQLRDEDSALMQQQMGMVPQHGHWSGNGDPSEYDMIGDESNNHLQIDHQFQSTGIAGDSGIPFPPIETVQMLAASGPQDVFHLLGLSRCSPSSLAHMSFVDPTPQTIPPQPGPETPSSVTSVLYEPVYNLNHLPPQSPVFRNLIQSLHVPPPYFGGSQGGIGGRNGAGGSCLFGDVGDDEQRDGMMACLFQDGHDSGNVSQKFDGEVFDFTSDVTCVRKGRRGGRKVAKQFTAGCQNAEKERRVSMNIRFDALRSLVPNPSKADRASTIADAIDYIKELLRTVEDLRLLVERKRRRNGKEGRTKRQKAEGNGKELDNSGGKLEQDDPTYGNVSVRTSWVQRKSKDTEVDVRVVDDEVTIKLVWRKKVNCLLLFISKALDEMQLDLHHVAGGHIGDHCCFLFNTKIYEGSSVYASAIASKLITVVDGQIAATSTSVSCY